MKIIHDTRHFIRKDKKHIRVVYLISVYIVPNEGARLHWSSRNFCRESADLCVYEKGGKRKWN